MLKHIYEHLKTRKKYNTLMIQKEGLAEDLQRKAIELDTQKLINQTERDEWKELLDKYIKMQMKYLKRRINYERSLHTSKRCS